MVKTGKIGFWILLPLFLFSNASIDHGQPVDKAIENGSYRLNTTGAIENVLTGHITFDEKVDTNSKGKQTTRLELKLENTAEHHMSFIISKELPVPGNLLGLHKVKTQAAGLLNNLDGVFGFADVSALGEQPFFTNNGSVQILEATDDLLRGKLDLRLQNFEGRSIELSGIFIATRSK